MTIHSILHRLRQVRYLLSGLTRRFITHRQCPACKGSEGERVARKLFHTLHQCEKCALLYRYPTESSSEMQEFYDDDYVEPGLTTELPDDQALAELIRTGFKGSAKDFSYHIRMMQALGVPSGATMLDYGANWGYTSWQFKHAGFHVQSFEISRPRAAFGAKLGLKISTTLSDVRPPFDLIYSCHVLEHVPNPQETIESMLAMLKPGGLVVGQTPNGSRAFREADRKKFQNIWGQVHPVLLTDLFVRRLANNLPFLIISDHNLANLSTWCGMSQEHRDCSRDGLFFAIRSARG